MHIKILIIKHNIQNKISVTIIAILHNVRPIRDPALPVLMLPNPILTVQADRQAFPADPFRLIQEVG
jgi:hypothetical protein